MFGRYQKCYCMNNNHDDNCDNDIIEKSCQNVGSYNEIYNENCNCGFDDEYTGFPTDPMYAQSYVPVQQMNEVFKPSVGLKKGTIYPELVSPYSPGDSMAEIAYLEASNEIGEGCNKCQ